MIKSIKSKINTSKLKYYSPVIKNKSTRYMKKYQIDLYVHNAKYESHMPIIENAIEKTFGDISKLSILKALQCNNYWYITFIAC